MNIYVFWAIVFVVSPILADLFIAYAYLETPYIVTLLKSFRSLFFKNS